MLIAKWRGEAAVGRLGLPALGGAPISYQAATATILRAERDADELEAVAPAWQPIGTAPQGYDGKKFNYVLFKGHSRGRSFSGDVVVSGYMDHDRLPVQFYQYRLNITQWMPLP